MTIDRIEVKGLRLWVHVGVLELERLHGQWFELNFQLWGDMKAVASSDDINQGMNYLVGIRGLQHQARQIQCFTIEHYSEQILNLLETMYGAIPMQVELSKCNPPIAGFEGTVSIRRGRRLGGVGVADVSIHTSN